MCGYDSPASAQLWSMTGGMEVTREWARKDAEFHHRLVMQSDSYVNSCFSVCATGLGGNGNIGPLFGASCTVDSFGHVLTETMTEEEEEVVDAEIDLDLCRAGKNTACHPVSSL